MTEFEIVTTRTGALSIRNKSLNEVLHNPLGPWIEAHEVYLKHSKLARKLTDPSLMGEELVVYDVGLGAAGNALAAVDLYRQLKSQGPVRPLKLMSFENNLELLKFALLEAHQFEHLNKYKDCLETLLRQSTFEEGGFRWKLETGDFLANLNDDLPKADVIFYDPYSPKGNPEMWSLEAFKKVFRFCKPGATLATFSRATPVRLAMSEAGFFVGPGINTGTTLNMESTQASTKLEEVDLPFDLEWLKRKPQVPEILFSHPQFKGAPQ